MRRAVTLIEILVASVILAVVGVPLLGVFSTGRQSIARTDLRREVRYFVSEILAHASRQPLHELFDQFGPGEVLGWDVAGRMRHQIADYDKRTGELGGDNPLGFTEDFLAELVKARLEARLYFQFYTRRELEVEPQVPDPLVADRASPKFGILHMQAGYARVDILDAQDDKQTLVGRWAQPIMCPAIVGRPGLKLASCPAIRASVRQRYLPLLARLEGWDNSDFFAGDAGAPVIKAAKKAKAKPERR